MQLIAPEVACLDLGAVNVYLCRDDDGFTLIDAGTPGKAATILATLAEWGGAPADLKRILITHADYDHAGSMAALQQQTGATVYAGAETARFLSEGGTPKHLPAPIHFVLSNFMRIQTIPRDAIKIVYDGDVLPVLGGLEALATPGHTMDHFAFYSPAAGVLFAGDTLETRTGHVKRSPQLITASTEANNESAIRLLNLAPAVFACGHGAPLTEHASDEMMALFTQIREEMGE